MIGAVSLNFYSSTQKPNPPKYCANLRVANMTPYFLTLDLCTNYIAV